MKIVFELTDAEAREIGSATQKVINVPLAADDLTFALFLAAVQRIVAAIEKRGGE